MRNLNCERRAATAMSSWPLHCHQHQSSCHHLPAIFRNARSIMSYVRLLCCARSSQPNLTQYDKVTTCQGNYSSRGIRYPAMVSVHSHLTGNLPQVTEAPIDLKGLHAFVPSSKTYLPGGCSGTGLLCMELGTLDHLSITLLQPAEWKHEFLGEASKIVFRMFSESEAQSKFLTEFLSYNETEAARAVLKTC